MLRPGIRSWLMENVLFKWNQGCQGVQPPWPTKFLDISRPIFCTSLESGQNPGIPWGLESYLNCDMLGLQLNISEDSLTFPWPFGLISKFPDISQSSWFSRLLEILAGLISKVCPKRHLNCSILLESLLSVPRRQLSNSSIKLFLEILTLRGPKFYLPNLHPHWKCFNWDDSCQFWLLETFWFSTFKSVPRTFSLSPHKILPFDYKYNILWLLILPCFLANLIGWSSGRIAPSCPIDSAAKQNWEGELTKIVSKFSENFERL